MAKSTRTRSGDETQLDVEERIRSRAYDLYQARGAADGNDVEDWLQAEQEIRGTNANKAAA